MVRFKHRYLVATVSASPDKVTELNPKELLAIIKESIATNFGDDGAGSTGQSLQVRSFDRASRVCIIRAARESHRMVRASLTLLNGTEDARISIKVEGVTGCYRTLKTVAMEAYARGYQRAGVDKKDVAALLQRQRQLLDVLQ